MSDKMVYGLAGVSCVIVVVGIGFIVGLVSEMTCVSQWPSRNPSWAWFQGCMIDTDDGRIPARNYRVF